MTDSGLNNIYERIRSLTNACNQQLVSENTIETKFKLIRDENISPGKFKQSELDPNIYYANSLTIKALKKDLFVIGEGFEDLECIVQCSKCRKTLDTQFWKFCPFCETQFIK